MSQITGNGQAQSGLGGAAGYGEMALARSDDASFAVDVSAVFENGFSIGGQRYGANSLFVATDGFITFGAAPGAGYLNDPSNLTTPFFAAFMADIDTRLDGEGAESGPIWVDVDAVNDVVTLTWQDVGFYRRNADMTNTFQIQLFDRGARGMDVVFRYESVSWTSGDLQGGWNGLDGAAAKIGLRTSAAGPMYQLPASGAGAAQLNLPQTLGNTGTAGLWVFNVPAIGRIIDLPLAETGGEGGDALAGEGGNDTLQGFAGNDSLEGGEGADVLDGGAGFDHASYALAQAGVVASLSDPAANTGAAAGDSYLAIEGLIGSAFNDHLTGDAGANRLDGGAGDDTLSGGLGADTLAGGAGFDWASYANSGAVFVDLGKMEANTGAAQGDVFVSIEGVLGSLGDDTLRGDGQDNVLDGNAGQDVLEGGAGHDLLSGAADHDNLSGNLGNDTLYGGSGADWLAGDEGQDTLIGGAGQDILSGGHGRDLFVFRALDELTSSARTTDVITGFSRGVDKIDLSQIDADMGRAGDDAFTLYGTAPPGQGNSGALYIRAFDNLGKANDFTMIYLDINGDGQSDAAIKVMGLHSFSASDFIL